MNTVFEDILSKIEKDERHTFDGCINKRFVREIILARILFPTRK